MNNGLKNTASVSSYFVNGINEISIFLIHLQVMKWHEEATRKIGRAKAVMTTPFEINDSWYLRERRCSK
jgi:hypothetical protein